jgi:hypothetical protein
MKALVAIVRAGALAGLLASVVIHVRGLAGAAGDAWPLVLAVFAAGAALTLLMLLAAWRIGVGRPDGWWMRAMDGCPTWMYLLVAAALLYGVAAIAYVAWTVRRTGPASIQSAPVLAGVTFAFFYAVVFAGASALAVAHRSPRSPSL